jgi:hypothetical protein
MRLRRHESEECVKVESSWEETAQHVEVSDIYFYNSSNYEGFI